MNLTPQQKTTIYKKLESNLSLGFTEALNFFDETLNNLRIEKQKEFEKAIGDMDKQIEALKLTVKDGYTPRKGIDYIDGIDGTTPVKGMDYWTETDINELTTKVSENVRSQIKDGKTPKAGVDYPSYDQISERVLIEIKSFFAGNKRMFETDLKPIIDKITSEIDPQKIANGLNTLEGVIDQKVIKGLDSTIKNLQVVARDRSVPKGGMGNVQHESKSVSSATTSISTTYKIAGQGFAIWAYYQGQFIVRGTHYTVNNDFKTLPLTFTPQDSTPIDLIYIRS